MPLVEIYAAAKYVPKIKIEELHDFASGKDMFNTPMGVMQIMIMSADRMYPVEACYVSIRCKGKPDRTKERLSSVMKKLGAKIQEMTGIENGKIRLESYAPDLQLAEVFPKKSNL